VAVLRTPDVVERLSSQGAEPIGSTPQAFAAYIKAETAKWAKVIRESGAKAE
jgi:tripartite-type tricarboxylate transporter receptor subunit TctC